MNNNMLLSEQNSTVHCSLCHAGHHSTGTQLIKQVLTALCGCPAMSALANPFLFSFTHIHTHSARALLRLAFPQLPLDHYKVCLESGLKQKLGMRGEQCVKALVGDGECRVHMFILHMCLYASYGTGGDREHGVLVLLTCVRPVLHSPPQVDAGQGVGQGAGRDGEHWAAGAAAPQQVRGPGPHVPAVQARGRRPGHRSHHDGRLCQGERTAARPGSLLSLGLAQPAPARPAPAQPAPALPTA
eukprot:1159145-Pelagomonas_calceolata.AAC.18